MRRYPASRISLYYFASICIALAEAIPTVDINDARFSQFIPPEPGDGVMTKPRLLLAAFTDEYNPVRSSCPGLNTLANHGFLPRDGKGLNLTSVIVAAYEGFGVSPETTGLITMAGLVDSKNDLSKNFSLKVVHRPDWQIEHDCSLTRKDRWEDPNVARFDPETWQTTLNELKKTPIVSAVQFGKAKAARIRQQRMRHPNMTYDAKSAANFATEIAKAMNTLGNLKGWARLEYLRTFFEQEKFPYDLGWRPHLYAADIGSVLGTGALILSAEPETLSQTSDGRVLLPTVRLDCILAMQVLCSQTGHHPGNIAE